MLPDPPRISVLIPAYNEETLLPRTIASVHRAFAEVGEPAYEVVVCDNNSTDRTSQVAQAAGARLVFEPHNQIARARNSAASRALGEWLIFLDADTELHRDALADTLQAFRSGRVGGGGSVISLDRPATKWAMRSALNSWNWISTTLKLAAGSYLFCLRMAWEEVGGFDERVYAGEELYFSHRVKRWARKKGLSFQILTRSPIITSARKMEWYSSWELLWKVVLLAVPGALKRRQACGLWYHRPTER